MVIDSAPLVAGACPMPTLVFHTDTLEALDCRVWYGPVGTLLPAGAAQLGTALLVSEVTNWEAGHAPPGTTPLSLVTVVVGRSGSSEGEVAADGFGLHRVAGVVAD